MSTPPFPSIRRVIGLFEKVIVLALLLLMAFTVMVSTVELAAIVATELVRPPFMRIELNRLIEVFGFFFMVLIGLELLETIRAYIEQDKVHAEIVLMVAIVAISRKVVILDYEKSTPQMMLSMAALILALAIGYFMVKQSSLRRPKPNSSEAG
jgi:uncharacterized membrane protein (DUF373 family)